MRFRMPRSPRMLGILWAMNALRLAKGARRRKRLIEPRCRMTVSVNLGDALLELVSDVRSTCRVGRLGAKSGHSPAQNTLAVDLDDSESSERNFLAYNLFAVRLSRRSLEPNASHVSCGTFGRLQHGTKLSDLRL